MTLLSIMLAYFLQLGAHPSFWTLLPGLTIGGIGLAMSMSPTTGGDWVTPRLIVLLSRSRKHGLE
jgi:hypothetical protein